MQDHVFRVTAGEFIPALAEYIHLYSCVHQHFYRLPAPVIAHIDINKYHAVQCHAEIIISILPHLALAVFQCHLLDRTPRMCNDIIDNPLIKGCIFIVDPVNIRFTERRWGKVSCHNDIEFFLNRLPDCFCRIFNRLFSIFLTGIWFA